jgi:hypothetical protein
MTIQIMKDQLEGLEAQGAAIAKDIEKFVKVSGIKEQKAKIDKELSDTEEELEAEKVSLKNSTDEKNKAMSVTTDKISKAITETLPDGKGVFEITEDNKFLIGWKIGRKNKAYSGLSGGELAAFNAALLNALGCGIICQESAEMDDSRVIATMEKLGATGKQVIMCSCHNPFTDRTVLEGWSVLSMGVSEEKPNDLEG